MLVDETRIITAIYISMNDSLFAQFFLPLMPFAQNTVHPGSVCPYFMYEQYTMVYRRPLCQGYLCISCKYV